MYPFRPVAGWSRHFLYLSRYFAGWFRYFACWQRLAPRWDANRTGFSAGTGLRVTVNSETSSSGGLQVFQDRTRMRRLYRAIPAACRVEHHKHYGRNSVCTYQTVEASQAEICCRYFKHQAMDKIKEHRGLPEHVEHAILTDADAQLDRSKQRQAQEQDAELQ